MDIRTPSDMALAQRMVRERIEHYLQIAEKHYKNKYPRPAIQWSLRGTTAGKASAGEKKIWLHPQLMRENFDDYLVKTVGHEVAHLIQYWEFGYEDNPSHGPKWRNVMYAFKLPAIRCHNYDVSKVPTRRKAKPSAPIDLGDGVRAVALGGVRLIQF